MKCLVKDKLVNYLISVRQKIRKENFRNRPYNNKDNLPRSRASLSMREYSLEKTRINFP